MLTGELRSKIDGVWNAFWAGGIANPLEVIEQITYLLFMRGLDEAHTPRGEQGQPPRQADGAADFPEGQGRHRQERRRRLRGHALVAAEEPRSRDDVRDRLRTRLPVPAHHGRGRHRARHPHEGRALHHPDAGAARQGGRSPRRNPDGGPRHQGRPLRIHAVEDRDRRPERPVPHAAPHHRADGRDDGAGPEGRDLSIPPAAPAASWSRPANICATTIRSCSTTRRAATISTRRCSTASISTAPCCASAR